MNLIIYFIILEDNLETQKLVRSYFKEFPNFVCKGCFALAADARDYMLENSVHLLMADIQLPDMNAMDMIESLPVRPLVVFMTGHNSKKSATKGHMLDAVHYLTKPFSFKHFSEALSRVKDRINGKVKVDNSLADHVVFGKTEGYRILLADIRYIEVDGNSVTIHLLGTKSATFRDTLKDVMGLLPETYFMVVHRSYIISLWHVHKFGRTYVVLYGTDDKIPVARQYRRELQRRIPEELARGSNPTS